MNWFKSTKAPWHQWRSRTLSRNDSAENVGILEEHKNDINELEPGPEVASECESEDEDHFKYDPPIIEGLPPSPRVQNIPSKKLPPKGLSTLSRTIPPHVLERPSQDRSQVRPPTTTKLTPKDDIDVRSAWPQHPLGKILDSFPLPPSELPAHPRLPTRSNSLPTRTVPNLVLKRRNEREPDSLEENIDDFPLRLGHLQGQPYLSENEWMAAGRQPVMRQTRPRGASASFSRPSAYVYALPEKVEIHVDLMPEEAKDLEVGLKVPPHPPVASRSDYPHPVTVLRSSKHAIRSGSSRRSARVNSLRDRRDHWNIRGDAPPQEYHHHRLQPTHPPPGRSNLQQWRLDSPENHVQRQPAPPSLVRHDTWSSNTPTLV